MSDDKGSLQNKNRNLAPQAQLFTLRIWVTNRKSDTLEWHGRIQHIQSGEVHYCQNWDVFITYVEKILREPFDF